MINQYFTGAHTSEGFKDFSQSQFDYLEKVIYLTGASSATISNVIHEVSHHWQEHDLEIWSDPLSLDSLSGVINTTKQVALVNGVIHTDHRVKVPGLIDLTLDLSHLFNRESLMQEQTKLIDLHHNINNYLTLAHHSFRDGLKVHDQLEDIFISALDFKSADQVARELIQSIFGSKTSSKQIKTTKHRFLGASTGDGVIDYIPSLTADITKRYFIKGRAGSGKSTLMKKIATDADNRGFSVEIYHCGFDPNSLDMIIIRELSVAIFDSTAPHEHEPTKHQDELIDLYQMTIKEGTDEQYAESIQSLTLQYKHHIQEGIYYLNKAKQKRKQHDSIYQTALIDTKQLEMIEQLKKS